jgi:hypothetical protein
MAHDGTLDRATLVKAHICEFAEAGGVVVHPGLGIPKRFQERIHLRLARSEENLAYLHKLALETFGLSAITDVDELPHEELRALGLPSTTLA